MFQQASKSSNQVILTTHQNTAIKALLANIIANVPVKNCAITHSLDVSGLCDGELLCLAWIKVPVVIDFLVSRLQRFPQRTKFRTKFQISVFEQMVDASIAKFNADKVGSLIGQQSGEFREHMRLTRGGMERHGPFRFKQKWAKLSDREKRSIFKGTQAVPNRLQAVPRSKEHQDSKRRWKC